MDRSFSAEDRRPAAASGKNRLDRGEVFDRQWPDIERYLQRRLQARGLSAWQRDDIVQETAARIWAGWDRFHIPDDLTPLATTVAKNLAVDHQRTAKRVTLTAEPPERASARTAVESAALARVDLDLVRRAMPRLIPRYQRLLMAEVGEHPLELSGTVAKVARGRARVRLAAMIRQGCALWLGQLPWRRSRQRLGRLANRVTSASHNLAPAAVGVAVAISVLGPGWTDSKPPSGPLPEDAARPGQVSIPAQRASATDLNPAASREWGRSPGAPAEASRDNGRGPQLTEQVGPSLTPVAHRPGEMADDGDIGPDGASGGGQGYQPLGDSSLGWRYRYAAKVQRCDDPTAKPASCRPARVRLKLVVSYGGQEQEVGVRSP